MPKGYESWDKDTILSFLLSEIIEPKLGKDHLFILTDYPASQAALAKTYQQEGNFVAERFEIYYRGYELCNGYHELTDAKEQRRRFEEANIERVAQGKRSLPIDEAFLEALERGIGDCCGVAVGFDRLMMLRHGVDTIESVMPFTWKDA